jgi:hypothetical protein
LKSRLQMLLIPPWLDQSIEMHPTACFVVLWGIFMLSYRQDIRMDNWWLGIFSQFVAAGAMSALLSRASPSGCGLIS